MIGKLLTLLIVLAFITVGIIFGSLNRQAVSVDYFFFQTYTALAFSLVTFLLAGVLLGGIAIYFSMVVKTRAKLRALRREVSYAKEQQAASSSKQLTSST